jgi:hypothetical protein
VQPSFEARKKARAPQDDVGDSFTVFQAHQKLPDGQITFARQNLSSPLAKNIPLCFLPKSVAYSVPSYPTRGALRTSRNARWDAMDARAATDERG